MNHLDYATILATVKWRMSAKRFAHTQAVIKLSIELAEAYGVCKECAKWSAALHDITKEQNLNEQLQIIKESDIMIDKAILQVTNVYHGLTAFLYARDELGITNTDVLNAIRYHTTGRAGMSILEKIIYVADACAYDRTYTQAAEIRKLLFVDIDEAMLAVAKFTIARVIERRQPIAIDTINLYNALVAN